MAYIYSIYNKLSEKRYIGQTIQPLHKRVYQHFYQAKRVLILHYTTHKDIKMELANQEITLMYLAKIMEIIRLASTLDGILVIKRKKVFNLFNQTLIFFKECWFRFCHSNDFIRTNPKFVLNRKIK